MRASSDTQVYSMHFKDQFGFYEIPLKHPSSHHLVGSSEANSFLDVLLVQRKSFVAEILLEQACKHDSPLLQSHHDLLISQVSLPHLFDLTCPQTDSPIAPRVSNSRVKI